MVAERKKLAVDKKLHEQVKREANRQKRTMKYVSERVVELGLKAIRGEQLPPSASMQSSE